MANNKTKRCVKNGGKNKSTRKKSTIHKKRRSSRKRSSKMRKGGSGTDEKLSEKFANLKADGALMILNITSIEKMDILENSMKTQPELYKMFKELIDVHRQELEK